MYPIKRQQSPVEQLAAQLEIAFVDSTIDDLESLVAGLRSDVERIVLLSDRCAPEEIARSLKHRTNLAAIHIFAHGRAGELSFGSGPLSIERLDAEAANLSEIGRALGKQGNLLLWSCRVASGERGSAFVAALARLTEAKV